MWPSIYRERVVRTLTTASGSSQCSSDELNERNAVSSHSRNADDRFPFSFSFSLRRVWVLCCFQLFSIPFFFLNSRRKDKTNDNILETVLVKGHPTLLEIMWLLPTARIYIVQWNGWNITFWSMTGKMKTPPPACPAAFDTNKVESSPLCERFFGKIFFRHPLENKLPCI